MQKLLINVIGNIGVGKTTLLNAVKPEFKEADYFHIDQYRKQHRVDSFVKEQLTWEYLRQDIHNSQLAILESSGTSINLESIIKTFKFTGGKVITILINGTPEECERRATNRGFESQYFPKGYTLQQSIQHIDHQLQKIVPDYTINFHQQSLDNSVRQFIEIIYDNLPEE